MIVKGRGRCEVLHNVAHRKKRVKQCCYRSSSCGGGCALNTDVHRTVSPGLHTASNSENQPALTQL